MTCQRLERDGSCLQIRPPPSVSAGWLVHINVFIRACRMVLLKLCHSLARIPPYERASSHQEDLRRTQRCGSAVVSAQPPRRAQAPGREPMSVRHTQGQCESVKRSKIGGYPRESRSPGLTACLGEGSRRSESPAPWGKQVEDRLQGATLLFCRWGRGREHRWPPGAGRGKPPGEPSPTYPDRSPRTLIFDL